MTNADGPFGFRPLYHYAGGVVRFGRNYSIASAYGTNLFRGDPVQMTGTGRNVAIAEAGNVDNIGVFWSVEYTDNNGARQYSKYWPASTVATDIVAHVYDDPNIVFGIQCESGTAFAEAMVGQLVDWVAAAGSTVSGLSGYEADISALATTGKSLRILGAAQFVDNEVAEHAIIEVLFIEHVLRGVVSGVGGI